MNFQKMIIDYKEDGMPYNVRLVIPFELLKKITPLIKDELMKGMISNDEQDRAVLDLQLAPGKIAQIKAMAATMNPTGKRKTKSGFMG